jgi:hypothetical protein
MMVSIYLIKTNFTWGESSFLSHYLRSMSVHVDNLLSLGLIVSAQRVNFPPVSSERSETPFLIGIKSFLLVLERKEAVLVK